MKCYNSFRDVDEIFQSISKLNLKFNYDFYFLVGWIITGLSLIAYSKRGNYILEWKGLPRICFIEGWWLRSGKKHFKLVLTSIMLSPV